MQYQFINAKSNNNNGVITKNHDVPKSYRFKYLWQILIMWEKYRRMKHIGWEQVGWEGLVSDEDFYKFKSQFCITVNKPARFYCTERWAVKRKDVHERNVVKMRILRWI